MRMSAGIQNQMTKSIQMNRDSFVMSMLHTNTAESRYTEPPHQAKYLL